MNRFLTLVLVCCFSFAAMADCTQAYKNEIERKTTKVEKSKKRGKTSTAVVFTAMTAFWGTMGVIMVGPAGVIIGLEFGAFFASPVAGTFYVINKVHRERVEDLTGAMSVITALDNESADQTAMDWLYNKLKKDHAELTMEDLKNEINYLNTNNSLCDGSLKKRPLGLKALERHLNKIL